MAENRIGIMITTDHTGAVRGIRQVASEAQKIGPAGANSLSKMRGETDLSLMSFINLKGAISATAAALAILKTIEVGIKIGSEYESSLFRMNETFKTHTATMVADAQRMADRMRHYYNFDEIAYAFTKTADSMKRYGIDGERYLQLVQRAADVGAAKTIELKDAIDRVESAMRGEAEASEYLGLTLNDTYMKNMAFGGALREVWEKLDDNTKAFYRWHEVMNQSEKYAGAAERATGTLSGSMKSLAGTIKDIVAPAVLGLTQALAGYINMANRALQATPLQKQIETLEGRLESVKNASGSGILGFRLGGPEGEHVQAQIRAIEEALARARRAQTHLDMMQVTPSFGSAAGGLPEPPGGMKFAEDAHENEMKKWVDQNLKTSRSAIQKYWDQLGAAQEAMKEGFLSQSGFDQIMTEAWENYEKALKKENGPAGKTPLDLADIDQDFARMVKPNETMYRQITDNAYDYYQRLAELSGDYEHAEQLRLERQIQNQKDGLDRMAADAWRSYEELAQKLGKEGRETTPEAQALLGPAWQAAQAAQAAAAKGKMLLDQKHTLEAAQASETTRLREAEQIAHVNVSYQQLTGTMEQQLKAQLKLIQAQKAQKLEEVGGEVTDLGKAYKQLYDEQERLAQLQISGSSAQGFAQGIKDATAMKTAYQEAREAGNAFVGDMRSGFSTLFSGIIKGEIKSFKDAWKSACDFMANAFANALSKMASSWIESQLFGGGGGIWSLFSGIGSLFGFGGGFTSAGGVHWNPSLNFPEHHSGYNLGKLGLKSNEHMAVIENEEIVLPKGTRMGASRAQAPTVIINNQTDTPINKDQVDWDPYENIVTVLISALRSDSRAIEAVQGAARGDIR